ncbi:sarcosine oxidase subunit gamma [Harenicola maris]
MTMTNSPLGGQSFKGLAQITEAPLTGMITLRGDLSAGWMADAVKQATGALIPQQRMITSGTGASAAWMSPDELLLLVDYKAAEGITKGLNTATAGQFCTAANVSNARVLIDIKGQGARSVLGKLTPADLRPESLAPMEMRRSRIAQVPAAFWLAGEDHFRLIAFRSVAQYAFDILKSAAHPAAAV